MFYKLMIGLGVTLATLAATAHAGWREVRTENFRIVTDSREGKARQMAADMELYRSALLRFFGLPETPEPEPIDVALYERLRMFSADFDGIGNAIGIYSASLHGPAFAAYVDAERDGRIPAGLSIVKHEFVHHLVYSRSTLNYPRWYAEGYAEFLRTMRIENGRAVIGELPLERAHEVQHMPWYGPELYEGAARWNVEGRGPLYGQAWVTVHYLLTSEDYRDRVPAMLRAIDGGMPPPKALQIHLDLTPNALRAEVRRYWNGGRLPVLYVPLDEADAGGDVQVRDLSSHEAFGARQKIVGRFRMGSSEKSDRWRQEHIGDLERYLSKAPNDVEARYWVASHHAMNRNETELRAAVDELIAVAPDHAYTSFARGKLALLGADGRGGPEGDREAVLAARTAFNDARKARPSFGRAHYAFAQSWLLLNDPITQEAVSAIEVADRLLGEQYELPFAYGALLRRAHHDEDGTRVLHTLKIFRDDEDLNKRIDAELARPIED